MKLGIIISTEDSETAWNAVRLGNFARNKGDEVKIFLLAKGVEIESISNEQFNIKDQMETFIQNKLLQSEMASTIWKCYPVSD